MPTDLKVTAIYDAIVVSWRPGFNGGFQQSFFVDYQANGNAYWNSIQASEEDRTIIYGLQQETKYLIRMFARNMINDSSFTNVKVAETGTSLYHFCKNSIKDYALGSLFFTTTNFINIIRFE